MTETRTGESFHIVFHSDIELLTVTDYHHHNTPFLMVGLKDAKNDNDLSIYFREHLLSDENIAKGYFLYGYFANEAKLDFRSIFPNE